MSRRFPQAYRFELDVGEIAEVWRRGSVIASWLLDLIADALFRAKFEGRVSDSGEGRWTLKAAIDEGVPASVLSSALYGRFASRGAADFADKLLSAMRHEFGGHAEFALTPPRIVWLMLPAAIVDKTIGELAHHLQPGDVLVDVGNSHYRHDIDRAEALKPQGIHYVDVGSLGFRVPSDHPSLDYGQSEQQDYPERTGISM